MFSHMSDEELKQSVEDWAAVAENLRNGCKLYIRNDRGYLIRHAQRCVVERFDALQMRQAHA